tara:strand:- start:402 stop:941 length:540 start_codon:yes stop_codon:yes gene_type:complete
MIYLFKNDKQLREILSYIEKDAGEPINGKSRKGRLIKYRVIYFALCYKYTDSSFDKIGGVINRNHSEMSHYKNKCLANVFKDDYFYKLYCKYVHNFSNITHKRIRLLFLNDIINGGDYNEVIECDYLEQIQDLRNKLVKLRSGLTSNELEYRKLSPEHQKVYNERAEAMLKMMNYTRSI